MSERVDQLLTSALALPQEEQLELLAAFMAAVDERGLRPFDDAWLTEIEQRSADFDSGSTTASSWEDVKERVRRKVDGGG